MAQQPLSVGLEIGFVVPWAIENVSSGIQQSRAIQRANQPQLILESFGKAPLQESLKNPVDDRALLLWCDGTVLEAACNQRATPTITDAPCFEQ